MFDICSSNVGFLDNIGLKISKINDLFLLGSIDLKLFPFAHD